MDNHSGSMIDCNIGRVHYLDQIRALAMMFGILVHACYPYCYAVQANWTLVDKTSSLGMTLGFFYFHIFRMTVFFFIAGFFANYLAQKRGIKGFIKNRLSRIALPFIIFWPLAIVGVAGLQVLAIIYLPQECLSRPLREAAATLKATIAQVKSQKSGAVANPKINQPPTGPAAAQTQKIDSGAAAANQRSAKVPASTEAPKTSFLVESQGKNAPVITIHFWFLFNLMLFCLLAALLYRVNSGVITAIFNKFFSSPLYLWLLPLLLVPALYCVGVPTPPAAHLIPQLWSFGYYGIFFLLGWQFFYRRDYLDRIEKHLGIFILFSLIASIFYLYLSPITKAYMSSLSSEAALAHIGATHFSEKILLVLLVAYLSVFLTIVSLILGKRFLNYNSKFMRYVSDSSYWIYLIHYPLVTYIQVFFAPLPISGYFKFFISSAIMLGIGLLTYRYIVRYTFIGTMLNGKRTRPQLTPSGAGVLAGN
jgi:glucans biosynthesis protein C